MEDVISSYLDLVVKLICNCVNRRGQKEGAGRGSIGRVGNEEEKEEKLKD